MIYDITSNFEAILENSIIKKIDTLPLSYPCKVSKVDDSGVFVEIETLLKKEEVDIPRFIPIMQSPYLTLPVKEGDIGIALNCSFLFSQIIEDEEITENERAVKENALFFVPLVSKSGFKGEVGKTILSDKEFKSTLTLEQEQITLKATDSVSLKMDKEEVNLQSSDTTTLKMTNEVSLQTAGTLEFKGATATLGEILGDILDMLMNANLDPVSGNGAPLNSPSLASSIPQIQAKIKGNLK